MTERSTAIRKAAALKLREQGRIDRAIILESPLHDDIYKLRMAMTDAKLGASEFAFGLIEILGASLAAEISGCKDMKGRIVVAKAFLDHTQDTLTRMFANAMVMSTSEGVDRLRKEFPSAFAEMEKKP